MVDGELWCRFFTLDELCHVNCLFGGYRVHDSNRAKLNQKQVTKEMETAISELKRHSSKEIKNNLKFLKRLKTLKTLLRFIRTENIAQRIFKNRYQNINYKCLYLKDGMWTTYRQRFMLP